MIQNRQGGVDRFGTIQQALWTQVKAPSRVRASKSINEGNRGGKVNITSNRKSPNRIVKSSATLNTLNTGYTGRLLVYLACAMRLALWRPRDRRHLRLIELRPALGAIIP